LDYTQKRPSYPDICLLSLFNRFFQRISSKIYGGRKHLSISVGSDRANFGFNIELDSPNGAGSNHPANAVVEEKKRITLKTQDTYPLFEEKRNYGVNHLLFTYTHPIPTNDATGFGFKLLDFQRNKTTSTNIL